MEMEMEMEMDMEVSNPRTAVSRRSPVPFESWLIARDGNLGERSQNWLPAEAAFPPCSQQADPSPRVA